MLEARSKKLKCEIKLIPHYDFRIVLPLASDILASISVVDFVDTLK